MSRLQGVLEKVECADLLEICGSVNFIKIEMVLFYLLGDHLYNHSDSWGISTV